MKSVDYTNKCGSCSHAKRIEGTRSVHCTAKRYDTDLVACDNKKPYPVYPMSKVKCMWYCKRSE